MKAWDHLLTLCLPEASVLESIQYCLQACQSNLYSSSKPPQILPFYQLISVKLDYTEISSVYLV